MATIQGVYVALFGRPADPTGLAYFNSVTKNGADLSGIGDLASTQEYKDRFAGFNNNQIITAIYQSLFNRDPEAAGLNFFVDALNKGTLNIKNIAIAILDGAQGTDKTVVDAKVASANVFTAALDTPTEIATYVGKDAITAGQAFLVDVTTTAKTSAQADTAITNLQASSNLGNTAVALTTGTADDVVVGDGTGNTTGGKNDTITGTLEAGDKINAGFGDDTLNATIAAGSALAPAAGEIVNVEKFFLTAAGAGASLDFANIVGETQVWNNNSAANALTASNITLGTTVGVTGAVNGGSTFGFAGATGTSDAATLAVKDVTVGGTVNIAGIESLTVAGSGTNAAAAVITVNAADATSVALSGTAALNVALTTANATSVTNSSTGAVTVDLTAANKLASYTGSAAVDNVTVDIAHTANETINTGAGNDTITVTTGTASNFTLTLTGGAGSDSFVIGSTGAGVGNVTATGAGTTTTADDVIKSLITITDFEKSADKITVGAAVTTRATLDNVQTSNIAVATDLKTAASLAAGYVGNDNAVAFVYGSDSYVLVTDATSGLNGGDTLIKVAGVSNLADFTAANFALV